MRKCRAKSSTTSRCAGVLVDEYARPRVPGVGLTVPCLAGARPIVGAGVGVPIHPEPVAGPEQVGGGEAGLQRARAGGADVSGRLLALPRQVPGGAAGGQRSLQKGRAAVVRTDHEQMHDDQSLQVVVGAHHEMDRTALARRSGHGKPVHGRVGRRQEGPGRLGDRTATARPRPQGHRAETAAPASSHARTARPSPSPPGCRTAAAAAPRRTRATRGTSGLASAGTRRPPAPAPLRRRPDRGFAARRTRASAGDRPGTARREPRICPTPGSSFPAPCPTSPIDRGHPRTSAGVERRATQRGGRRPARPPPCRRRASCTRAPRASRAARTFRPPGAPRRAPRRLSSRSRRHGRQGLRAAPIRRRTGARPDRGPGRRRRGMAPRRSRGRRRPGIGRRRAGATGWRCGWLAKSGRRSCPLHCTRPTSRASRQVGSSRPEGAKAAARSLRPGRGAGTGARMASARATPRRCSRAWREPPRASRRVIRMSRAAIAGSCGGRGQRASNAAGGTWPRGSNRRRGSYLRDRWPSFAPPNGWAPTRSSTGWRQPDDRRPDCASAIRAEPPQPTGGPSDSSADRASSGRPERPRPGVRSRRAG